MSNTNRTQKSIIEKTINKIEDNNLLDNLINLHVK